MTDSDLIEILTQEAKQHKRQERYHRRRARTLMEQAEVLRTEFNINTTMIGKTKGGTASVRNKNK